MTQTSPPRPPRLAVWLIELFVPEERALSVVGDLLEEFSDVATKSSIGDARSWYWRQALTTILHFLASGFRTAPRLMTGVLAGGVVLVELGWWFAGWSFNQGLLFLDLYVFPYYTPHSRFGVFLLVFLLNSGNYLYRFTVSMMIGCVVALLSKGREMSATVALSLVCSVPALARFLLFLRNNYVEVRHWQIWVFFFGGLFALVPGGAIAKLHRLRSLRAVRS